MKKRNKSGLWAEPGQRIQFSRDLLWRDDRASAHGADDVSGCGIRSGYRCGAHCLYDWRPF